MDYSILYHALQENHLVDLNVTLNDVDGRTKEFAMHRIILLATSKYFEKLLTNCKEKDSDKITINGLPDVNIAYDTIMKSYGQNFNTGDYPEWYRSGKNMHL